MRPQDIKSNLTASRLREVLRYDEDSGLFYWASLPHQCTSSIKVGDVAGWIENTGYRRILLDGKKYVQHRLVWLYVYGEWPPDRLDHADCDKSNNKLENLRLANDFQNSGNKRIAKNNSVGFKGVTLHQSGRYHARICKNGKSKSLGLYDTPEEAFFAYENGSKNVFGEFARGK